MPALCMVLQMLQLEPCGLQKNLAMQKHCKVLVLVFA
jgi:hypothetical protein